MPPLVLPLGSPGPAGQQARQARQAQQAPSGQPNGGLAAVLAPPGSLPFATPAAPSLIFAVPSPAPQVGPVGTRTLSPEDVLANAPPRRLITSFEALRETAGGGATSQLKSWATDTSLVLGVPFRTQIDGTTFSLVNCGPASLAMVLVAFGLDVDPPSVRGYLNYLVGNYDAEQGTSLYVLARIAREAGLSTFGSAAGLQGWTVNAVREQIRAGHPVITLTKYRRLPGHFGSVTEFDHYIVITGLAGEDFVYNDAAYSTEYGYNLLISPAQLEAAWAGSSVPRHALAVGLGDSLRPLPIVPHRLTAESLAAAPPREEAVDVAVAPMRVNRAPAAEWLREEMLDRLGARTAVVDGEPTIQSALAAPPTRLDPAEAVAGAVVQGRPVGAALVDASGLAIAETAAVAGHGLVGGTLDEGVASEQATGAAAELVGAAPDQAGGEADDDGATVEAVADARLAAGAEGSESVAVRVGRARRGGGEGPRADLEAARGPSSPPAFSPLILALMGLGLMLMACGGLAGLWRREVLAQVRRVRAGRPPIGGDWTRRLPGRRRVGEGASGGTG
jgi:hypothetical protein